MAVCGLAGLAGCLGSDDSGSGDDDDGDDDSSGGSSTGTAEITFRNDTYTFDDASCRGSRTFPPENEMIFYRDYDSEFEFWVERHDPDESDVVEVHLAFPHDSSLTIGEIEAYTGRTTIDEIEFELESHTEGTVELEPSHHMNDDVEHHPDGGVVEWNISC